MFAVSKLVHFLLHPVHLIAVLLILGWALRMVGWRRLGGAASGVAIGVFLVTGFTPLGAVLGARLEMQTPPATYDLQRVDGAIILGGVASYDPRSPIGYELGGNAERFTTAVALRVARPDLPLIMTGGDGTVFGLDTPEPVVARHFLQAMGVDIASVMFEEASRNTRENALFTRDLIGEEGGQWLLVTSAHHMPRALATFETAFAGTDVAFLPVPVDFTSSSTTWSLTLNPAGRMGATHAALREWIGVAYYRARGWIE